LANEEAAIIAQKTSGTSITHQPSVNQQHTLTQVIMQGGWEDDISSVSGDNTTSKNNETIFYNVAVVWDNQTLEEEMNLVTAKLGKIFKRQKFVDADEDLVKGGNIVRVLLKEMHTPLAYCNMRWEH